MRISSLVLLYLYVIFIIILYIGAYFTQFYAHAEQALSNFPGKILL